MDALSSLEFVVVIIAVIVWIAGALYLWERGDIP